MAKGMNQKLKILYLAKMFLEETDEESSMSISDIKAYLARYDISADRKTLYADFEDLRQFGMDIIHIHEGKTYTYYLGSREFELPELKLLVDTVQSAKFLTEKRSNELIRKLEKLTSKNQAKRLQRQVLIAGRVKSINEKIYYNVDTLHEAISQNSQITFHYCQWNVDKQMELRRGGRRYQTSPWMLLWDDENYYLVGFDSEEKMIKHYRVDKMQSIEITNERRNGQAEFKQFDLPKYTKSLFGMFSGTEKMVTLEAHNDMVGTVIDRFGKEVTIIKTDAEHFKAIVNVAVSGQFFGWVISLGGKIRISGPDEVVEQMKQEIYRLQKQYL